MTAFEDLQDLYENAPCGYLSMAPNGQIRKANRTLSGWLGVQTDDLIGLRLRDLLSVGSLMLLETHLAALLSVNGFFDEVSLELKTQAGVRLPVMTSAIAIRDSDGQHSVTRMAFIRASERRRYERELVEARAAADAARKEVEKLLEAERLTAQFRDQFIAVLGHDLRNPVAAIDAGASLLLRSQLDDRSRQVVALMQGSVVRMRGLIDNVLDFARARLGEGLGLVIDPTLPLQPVLEQVVAELQWVKPDRQMVTDFNITMPVPLDHVRIGQLLSNLLANALTHGSDDTPVRISAITRDGAFELSVANSGDPIPEENLGTLFQPFVRGRSRPSQQGLGLGLYIASEIARAHSGTLSVSSDRDETRFTFRMQIGT